MFQGGPLFLKPPFFQCKMAYFKSSLIFMLLCCPFWVMGQTHCMKGYVYDEQSKMPVNGAYIYHLDYDRLAVSDTLGFFEFCGDLQPEATLQVSHLGYEDFSLRTESNQTSTINIYLKLKSFDFDEVVVSANSYTTNLLSGIQKIDQSQILSMPTLLGEADVVRTLQQLSGIQTVSEGVGGIFVRGGGAGHNLVMLDNMELMNPVHLMGIYSVFNPLTTGQAEVFKGNSPVYLRGKIASSIIVSSINPFLVPNNIQGSIGNMASNLSLAQKSRNNKFSIITGVRQSYLGLAKAATSLFMPRDENYFNRYFYSFYDFNGRVSFRPWARTSLTVGWYLGADNFLINDDNVGYDATNNYGNQSIMGEIRTILGDEIALTATINGTRAWSGFEGDMLGNRVDFSSGLQQVSAKLRLLYENSRHTVRFGMDAYRYQTTPQNLHFIISEDTIRRRDEFFNADVSLYVEDAFSITEQFSIYGGLRFYKYWNYEGQSSGASLWRKPCKSVSSYVPLVPALSFSFSPNVLENYKLAYSYNVQMGHLASFSSIPLPNDIWMMSSGDIQPERAHQLSCAYLRELPFGSVIFEAYGKRLENQLVFNVNTEKDQEMSFEDHFFKGKGKAYGAEISIHKTRGLLTGMLNYTLSRSKRSFPDIYGGQWFNDKFDRIHDLSLVVNFKLSDRWELGGNWVFSTGNSLTLPSGRYWTMGMIMSHYEGYNTFRMPSYHRLDLSANLKLNSRHLKQSILNFSLINVYNRSNPYFIYYKVYQESSKYDIEIKAAQVSLFPIMPSVNWRFKF
jgi:hypothetical protein